MPWREAFSPMRMERVALVAPVDARRAVLEEVAQREVVELHQRRGRDGRLLDGEKSEGRERRHDEEDDADRRHGGGEGPTVARQAVIEPMREHRQDAAHEDGDDVWRDHLPEEDERGGQEHEKGDQLTTLSGVRIRRHGASRRRSRKRALVGARGHRLTRV